MKAKWNNKVVAEASKEDLILIEGNWYFPAESIKKEFFTESETHTTCPWKGLASYYNVVVDGVENKDAAWYYKVPKEGSVEKVGKDFANYIAFWNGVEVVE